MRLASRDSCNGIAAHIDAVAVVHEPIEDAVFMP
jgi:hypothetical protein